MSLRARLIAALLVLTTAGLVTLAAVTYAEQRSFLFERVDRQAQDAVRPVTIQLAGPPVPGFGGRPGFAPPPPIPRGDDQPGPDGGSGPQGLERGTYGELRNSSGAGIDSTTVTSYGEAAVPAPNIPATVPTDHAITVGSKGGSGLRYRVIAEPTHDHPG